MATLAPMLLFPLVACDGAKDTTTPAPTGDTGTPAPQTYEPTWTGVQQLFVDHCDRCHPAQQGLDLHVALPEDVITSQVWIVPGDPDNSYLWQLVSGQSSEVMPQDTGPLPLETVQAIHDWIAAGASFEE